MKITDQFLAIPPYLSVEWKEVSSLQNGEEGLIVSLKNGDKIVLSHLAQSEIDQIFSAHQKYLQSAHTRPRKSPFHQLMEGLPKEISPDLPILFRMMPPGEGLSFPFHHSQEHSDMPRLPDEILDKLTSVLQHVMPGLSDSIPAPALLCSCPFCQISSYIHKKGEKEEFQVTEEDLKFRDWEVKLTGERLYSVESPLNPLEKYTVFLGDPLGCTCGNKGCDHLIAVLKS